MTCRHTTKVNFFVSLNITETPILQGHAMVCLPSGIFLMEDTDLSINPHSNTIYSVYFIFTFYTTLPYIILIIYIMSIIINEACKIS